MNKKLLTLPLVMAPLLASCGPKDTSIVRVEKKLIVKVRDGGDYIPLPLCVSRSFSIKAGEQKTFKIKYIHKFITIFEEVGCLSQFINFDYELPDPNELYDENDFTQNKIDVISEICEFKINTFDINKSSADDYNNDWFRKIKSEEESNSYFLENTEAKHGEYFVADAFKGVVNDSVEETITITSKENFEKIYMIVFPIAFK